MRRILLGAIFSALLLRVVVFTTSSRLLLARLCFEAFALFEKIFEISSFFI